MMLGRIAVGKNSLGGDTRSGNAMNLEGEATTIPTYLLQVWPTQTMMNRISDCCKQKCMYIKISAPSTTQIDLGWGIQSVF